MSQHLARVRFSSHGHQMLHKREREHVTKQLVLIQADFKEAITRRRRQKHGLSFIGFPILVQYYSE